MLGFEQGPPHAHRADRDLEALEPGRTQGFGEQAHHFGVGVGAFGADVFQADLCELARGGPGVGLAEDALGVAEFEGAFLAAQACGAQAGHLHGDVGTQGKKVACRVEELEGALGTWPAVSITSRRSSVGVSIGA